MIIYYDKNTGSILWRTGTNSVGHNPNLEWEMNGVRQVAYRGISLEGVDVGYKILDDKSKDAERFQRNKELCEVSKSTGKFINWKEKPEWKEKKQKYLEKDTLEKQLKEKAENDNLSAKDIKDAIKYLLN